MVFSDMLSAAQEVNEKSYGDDMKAFYASEDTEDIIKLQEEINIPKYDPQREWNRLRNSKKSGAILSPSRINRNFYFPLIVSFNAHLWSCDTSKICQGFFYGNPYYIYLQLSSC